MRSKLSFLIIYNRLLRWLHPVQISNRLSSTKNYDKDRILSELDQTILACQDIRRANLETVNPYGAKNMTLQGALIYFVFEVKNMIHLTKTKQTIIFTHFIITGNYRIFFHFIIPHLFHYSHLGDRYICLFYVYLTHMNKI